MKTKLTRIKYFKWRGDPIEAGIALQNEKGISPDFSGNDLILRMNKDHNSFIRISRGLNVVAIASPKAMGYVYYRMSDPQLNQYLDISNQDNNIVLN